LTLTYGSGATKALSDPGDINNVDHPRHIDSLKTLGAPPMDCRSGRQRLGGEMRPLAGGDPVMF
jgi:hypothetical protein